MADDVITMITTDHRELERLLTMMKEDKSSRPLALPVAVAMLAAHSRAEESQVYPAMAGRTGDKTTAKHSTQEHRQAEQLGRRLLKLPPASGEFDIALEELASAVLHHAQEEERDILPALSKAAGRSRLQELGLAFAARRAQELTGKQAGGRRRRVVSDGASKAELYEQAREMGIPGRSSMAKRDLARAVSRQKARTAR